MATVGPDLLDMAGSFPLPGCQSPASEVTWRLLSFCGTIVSFWSHMTWLAGILKGYYLSLLIDAVLANMVGILSLGRSRANVTLVTVKGLVDARHEIRKIVIVLFHSVCSCTVAG